MKSRARLVRTLYTINSLISHPEIYFSAYALDFKTRFTPMEYPDPISLEPRSTALYQISGLGRSRRKANALDPGAGLESRELGFPPLDWIARSFDLLV